MRYESYASRPLATQIKVDQLLRCYPYSLYFYEKMTDREIAAFHQNNLSDMARMTVETVLNPQDQRQLTLF